MRKIFNVGGTNDRHKEVLTPPASHCLRQQLCSGVKVLHLPLAQKTSQVSDMLRGQVAVQYLQ